MWCKMKTRLVIIIIFAFSLLMPYSIDSAFASCVAEVDYDEIFLESELVFKGTVVFVDNSPGPQKIHFDVHEISKGIIPEERYILENSEVANHGNVSYSSSSVDVGYKVGTTYNVYVTSGQTSLCTTKPTAPPSGYELPEVLPPVENQIFCHFGRDSTPIEDIFEQDMAVKAFLEKYPNATRSVKIEQSDLLQDQVRFETENKNEKEVLLIKFYQNENGCYRPSSYHYSFTSGEIDVTIRNTLGNFSEIINLIKLDEKKIEDFYTKNCNPIKLDFILNGDSEPYFCKYDLSNSIEMSLQKHTGGIIEIHIPDKVMNALFYNCVMTDEYIVLNNGEEILYDLTLDKFSRIFKMDLPQGYNKMEIIGFSNFGNPGFCGSIWNGESSYISPLMQTKIGVESSMVQCNDDLTLMLKPTEFTKAVCVTMETREKLIQREWIDAAPCHGGCGTINPFDEYSKTWDDS